ncbi:hypothetical protein M8J75_008349 [Diaphorina citri]|nr:hypothetical protein M8J75_008349 [Diaphorina citri]
MADQDLDQEQINMLKKAFAMFDSGKRGTIEKEKVRTILNTLGHFIDDVELETVIDEINVESGDKISFEEFLQVACHFLRDDDVLEKELKEAFRLYDKEDDDVQEKELKEAFRLYDKEGHGYIPTSKFMEMMTGD